MRAKLVIAFIAVMVVLATGWTFNKSQNSVDSSDLVLANVEALANNESGDVVKLPCTKDDKRCTVIFKLESGETSKQEVPQSKNT